ncbi:hypothetical protein CLV88_101387 [Shimia abyssi]|uniref:Uncharacterized protein n=1 Tax=Shimia abyssi TaxID=1662395 RepID=A0A2P8FJR3_9RHOB|nr:hypothetical protein CLV88_101387 [Shimia abyssi]
MAALRRLRWAETPCRIKTAETDADARLDEVMENLGRQELSALDRCRHLWELKQAWEEIHPQTAHGKASSQKGRKAGSGRRNLTTQNEVFGFAKANAEALGLSRRTMRRTVAIWEGLAPDMREHLLSTSQARKQAELKALSFLSLKQQLAVLKLILTNEDVRNVAGALLALDRGTLPSRLKSDCARCTNS